MAEIPVTDVEPSENPKEREGQQRVQSVSGLLCCFSVGPSGQLVQTKFMLQTQRWLLDFWS